MFHAWVIETRAAAATAKADLYKVMLTKRCCVKEAKAKGSPRII